MLTSIIGPQFPKKVIPFINEAKVSICIVVFDWRWYFWDPASPVSLFNQAIIQASRRGVKIQVITNCNDIIKILKSEKIEAKKLLTPYLVHSKMILIDSKILVIGSHNYTQAAFTTNHEISAIIDDADEICDFVKYFQDLWQL